VWIRLLIEDKPFEVWGGAQVRDFTYVDDVVAALLRAAANDATNGKVYNLGGDRKVTLHELAELLVAANGGGQYAVREFPADRKRIDIGDYYADDRLIRTTLGWQPTISLRDGLARTLAYYREHLERYL